MYEPLAIFMVRRATSLWGRDDRYFDWFTIDCDIDDRLALLSTSMISQFWTVVLKISQFLTSVNLIVFAQLVFLKWQLLNETMSYMKSTILKTRSQILSLLVSPLAKEARRIHKFPIISYFILLYKNTRHFAHDVAPESYSLSHFANACVEIKISLFSFSFCGHNKGLTTLKHINNWLLGNIPCLNSVAQYHSLLFEHCWMNFIFHF